MNCIRSAGTVALQRILSLMTKKLLAAIAALLFLVSTRPLPAQTTNTALIADLNDLITRINDKITQGKTNEIDYVDNLKEFDALFAKHKDAWVTDRAQILVMKAKLYLDLLRKPEKALEIYRMIRDSCPGVQINGNTDELIRVLQKLVDAEKIRRTLVIGAKFPDFEVTDLAGKPLASGSLRGKVVLIDFWATWCMPCMVELPFVMKTYNAFHENGFEIIGVSLDQDRQRLEAFLKVKDLRWPQYNDGLFWETKLVLKYGVEALPATYLLDREGRIAGINLRGDQLQQAVAMELRPRIQRWLWSRSRAVDRLIEEHRYVSLVVVFGGGFLFGMLARRRGRKPAATVQPK